MDAFSVEGKRVVITGGSGYLGQHWTEHLKAQRAIVHVVDAAGVKPGAVPPVHPVDVTDVNALRRELAWYRDLNTPQLGAGRTLDPAPPDALICAAAIDAPPGTPGCGPFEDVPLGDWESTVRVNLTGATLACQVFGAEMARAGRGSIVLVSSVYGLVGPDQRRYGDGFVKPAAYSASKGALLGLAKYLAAYWGPKGVRVNAVAFGGVDRPGYDPGFRASYEGAVPLGRFARPDEYNGVVQFLVSDASTYLNGAVLVVDGGYSAW